MVLSHKCSCGPSLTFLRNICIHSVLETNHYKALGVNPSATQAEIKSAYYELSKRHHPDKNQGSEKSAKIFRDISAAYEVLGNIKLRREYDREQNFVRRSESSNFQNQSYKPDYNDEIERIIFERRKRMTKRYGKTPYYDFDEWYRAHYGSANKFYGNMYRATSYKYENVHANKMKAARLNQIKLKFALLIYALVVLSLFWLKHKKK